MDLILIANNQIRDEFKNGFKTYITGTLSDYVKDNHLMTQDITRKSINSLFWKFAGTIVLIAGLFSLIVELTK